MCSLSYTRAVRNQGSSDKPDGVQSLLSPCTGPIPSWLGGANGLKELDLSLNVLTGEVSICQAVSDTCVVTDDALFDYN